MSTSSFKDTRKFAGTEEWRDYYFQKMSFFYIFCILTMFYIVFVNTILLMVPKT
jgi:hypothetical protein